MELLRSKKTDELSRRRAIRVIVVFIVHIVIVVVTITVVFACVLLVASLVIGL